MTQGRQYPRSSEGPSQGAKEGLLQDQGRGHVRGQGRGYHRGEWGRANPEINLGDPGQGPCCLNSCFQPSLPLQATLPWLPWGGVCPAPHSLPEDKRLPQHVLGLGS